MATKLSYTNTPNYIFNLLTINNELKHIDLIIFIFINQYKNLKFKANNQRIIDSLGLSNKSIVESIKRLRKFNLISTSKLPGSNSNLHQVNDFAEWTLPKKHLLLVNEVRMNCNKDVKDIINIFKDELNYSISVSELEDIVNVISNNQTQNEEDLTYSNEPIIENVAEDTIVHKTEENTPIEPIAEAPIVEDIVSEVTEVTDIIEHIVEETITEEIIEPIVDINKYELTEKIIEMVNNNQTPMVVLSDQEIKSFNLYIQSLDFNDCDLNNHSYFFASNLLFGDISSTKDSNMFKLLPLINKATKKQYA